MILSHMILQQEPLSQAHQVLNLHQMLQTTFHAHTHSHSKAFSFLLCYNFISFHSMQPNFIFFGDSKDRLVQSIYPMTTPKRRFINMATLSLLTTTLPYVLICDLMWCATLPPAAAARTQDHQNQEQRNTTKNKPGHKTRTSRHRVVLLRSVDVEVNRCRREIE